MQPFKRRAFTFSPFGRSIARTQPRTNSSNVQRKSHISYTGNKFLQNTEEKSGSTYSEDEDGSEGLVQADFVFFDPKPNDFHGVKLLLKSYLDDKEWDISGFVGLILAQTTVGTVVKIENSEDVGIFSVITAINLGRYKGNSCIVEIKDYLVGVCHSDDTKFLKPLLEQHEGNVGLLVSEHVVNLPLELLPSLYDALFDEVLWATEDEPTKELRNSFCFKFYILLSRIYMKKNVNRKMGLGRHKDDAIIYVKVEDEIFHELSSWSLCFPLRRREFVAREPRNYELMGILMVLDADKVELFRRRLGSLIMEA